MVAIFARVVLGIHGSIVRAQKLSLVLPNGRHDSLQVEVSESVEQARDAELALRHSVCRHGLLRYGLLQLES